MNKIIILSITLIFATLTAMSQTYHEDDKEGLRVFLRQPSAEKGKINAEQLGLKIEDTLNWQSDEEWVSKIIGLIWNNEISKRLVTIGFNDGVRFYEWRSKKLAGTLDASKWTELGSLNCSGNQLTALNLSANTKLATLHCSDNQLSILDLRANTKLVMLFCDHNLLTALNLSVDAKLHTLHCSGNHLLLSDLFVPFHVLKNDKTNKDYYYLSPQTLPAQTIRRGEKLEFSTPQNVFNGIYTEYTVIQNDKPTSKKKYTVTDGKISFNTIGIYTVTMTNKAIFSTISKKKYPAEVIIKVKVRE